MTDLPSYLTEDVRRFRRDIQQEYKLAYLGDGKNPAAIDVPGATGLVYVRYPAGVDQNGNQRYSPPTPVRVGLGAAYLKQPGATVYIGKDFDGFDAVMGGSFSQTIAAGINPAVTNTLDPSGKFTTNDNYIPLKSYPVGTGNTPATVITVRAWIYDDDNGDYNEYTGSGTLSDKIDLAPYIPAIQEHCRAVVWLDTLDNALSVTASTAQSMFTALDETDIQECFDARPPDSVPVMAYYLADGATVIRQSYKHRDLRNMINTPRLLGNPNPITKQSRLRANRQLIYHGELTLSGEYGELTVDGELIVL